MDSELSQLDLSSARGLLAAGRATEAREALLQALHAIGLPADARPIDERAEPAWVLVMGMSMENGWSVHVLPESILDEESRAALLRCDGQIIEPDSPAEAPELYRAWFQLLARTGRGDWDTLEMMVVPEDLGLDRADYDRWWECWLEHWPTQPATRGAALARPLSRILWAWENL
jgi:hypothetical protein